MEEKFAEIPQTRAGEPKTAHLGDNKTRIGEEELGGHSVGVRRTHLEDAHRGPLKLSEAAHSDSKT